MNIPTPAGFNLRIVDTFLTQKKAEDLVDRTPGTFIERYVATK